MHPFLCSSSSDQYVIFSHDPLSHRCVIVYEGVDESLRIICKYQQNVPQYYYLFYMLVLFYQLYFDVSSRNAARVKLHFVCIVLHHRSMNFLPKVKF